MINKHRTGLTLIELLVVLAIIGVMFSAIVIAINPAHQLAKARDTQRETDLFAILAAVYRYSADHSGDLPDTDGDPLTSNFPTTPTCIGTDLSCFDLAGAGDAGEEIVPVYMPNMPKDPRPVNPGEGTDANTGYLIFVDSNDRLIASASGETKTISAMK